MLISVVTNHHPECSTATCEQHLAHIVSAADIQGLRGQERRLLGGDEEGSYLRLIDFCITQLKAQRPSRFCNESKEEGKTGLPERFLVGRFAPL